MYKLLIHDFYIFLIKIAFQIMIDLYLKNNTSIKKHVFLETKKKYMNNKSDFN